MKKKLKLLMLIGIISVLFAGCFFSSENIAAGTEGKEQPFELEMVGYSKIDNKRTFYYYRDIVTDQLFLEDYLDARLYDSDSVSLTAMSDPETGLPLTYTRYLELYEKKNSNE